MNQNLAGIDIGQNRLRARSASNRIRAGSISDPDKKQVIKSLLDLFLETTMQENAGNDIEDGSPQINMKLLEDIESFLHQVALCYQSYGCPTHTIESNMGKVAKGLGITAQFLVFPSHIFVEIDNVKTEQNITRRHNQFFRSSYGYNFYKLQLVDELVRRISSYAQEAEDVAEVQALNVDAVDEAFTRARAYSSALISRASGSGSGLPMPLPSTLAGTHYNSYGNIVYDADESGDTDDTGYEMPQIFGSPNSQRRMTNSVRSPSKSYLAPIEEDNGEDDASESASGRGTPLPLLEQLATWPSLPSLQHTAERSTSRHDEKSKSTKLRKMILNLARLGPNVYESGGAKDARQDRTYRNIFAKLAVQDGVKLIKAVIKQKPQYNLFLKVFLVGTASFGACGLFYRGSWKDCAISLALGTLIGSLELISLVSPTFSRIYEFVATFVASLIIRAINARSHDVCYRAVLLGTIVFTLQGVTITLAFVDLMTKDLITGTTRLFFGMLVSALIGFAMDVSTSTYASITDRSYEDVLSDSSCDDPISRGWYPLMFVIMSMSFNILLEAHINQLLQMLFITACSYMVYYFLAQHMTNQLPVILASFTASLLSNLYSRRTGQPAVVYIIPAIFLLVPGSVAASSFYTVLLLDLNGGLNLTFAVVTGALSVAIGIFAASALVPVPDVEEFFRKANAAYPGLSKSRSSSSSGSDCDDGGQQKNDKRAANRNSGLTF